MAKRQASSWFCASYIQKESEDSIDENDDLQEHETQRSM